MAATTTALATSPTKSTKSTGLTSFLSHLWSPASVDSFASSVASGNGSSSGNNASSFSSSFSLGRPFCRICHEGGDGDNEPLISPCRCSGSVALVHRQCLERWLSSQTHNANNSNNNNNEENSGSVALDPNDARSCELCGFAYSVEAKRRPFKQWALGRPMSSDQRNLLSDLVCFLLLTPLAAASAYLCFLGSRHYFHTSRGEAIGLIFLASFLLLIYLLWLGICIRFHYTTWQAWRETNRDVKLVQMEEVKVEK